MKKAQEIYKYTPGVMASWFKKQKNEQVFIKKTGYNAGFSRCIFGVLFKLTGTLRWLE